MVLKGCRSRSLGLSATSWDTIQAVHDLCVHWMLDPQRSLLVERGDACLLRNELRTGRIGCRLYERDDRLVCCAVVPGRQGIRGPSPPRVRKSDIESNGNAA